MSSTSGTPVYKQTLTLSGNARDLTMRGGVVYATDTNYRINVIDTTVNPVTSTTAGNFVCSNGWSTVVDGSYAYVDASSVGPSGPPPVGWPGGSTAATTAPRPTTAPSAKPGSDSISISLYAAGVPAGGEVNNLSAVAINLSSFTGLLRYSLTPRLSAYI